MRLMSRIGPAVLGVALLVAAGCQKARPPEPAAVTSSPLPNNPPETKGIVTELPRSTPATSFTLQIETLSLKVAPGASTKVKVTAARNGYQGPVAVELRNLPARVTAARATLAAGAASLEIEVTAAADATPGSKTDVQAVGTAASPSTAMASSAPFTIDVTGPPPAPFSLKTGPASIKLAQGGRAKVKITAARSGYQGPIAVELRNLPAGVEAPKGVIPKDKDEVELELTATSSATLGIRKDVTALGTTTAPASPQVVSPNFTLDLHKAAAQDFTLRVEHAPVHLKQGGKAKVTVVADRGKGYQGPITVELHNLPGHVTAAQSVIPQGKDRVSLDVMADLHASPGDKLDVSARGHSSAGDIHTVSSAIFVVSVQVVNHPAAAPAANTASHPKGTPAGRSMPAPAPKPPPKPRVP